MTKPTNIFQSVLWFKNRQKFDIDFFDVLQPQRLISDNPRYKNGLFRSEKCGRDIQYESGLELKFIEEQLENNDEIIFYFEQPIQVMYRRGKRRAKTHPDFGAYLKSREFVIIEVKSLAEMIDHRVQAKTEGLMEFCSSRGFGLLLTDGRHTPEHLLHGQVNVKLEEELTAALESGFIRKRQGREIMKSCNATYSELHRAILNLDLKYKPHPFKLQRGNQSPVFRQIYFEKKNYDDLAEDRFKSMFE